ncbi:hypothetical protein HNY73_017655 [Argiope bruennichi]|uniref:Uncharacterized protein n=1 Tax=Argiope bruennichi TaxID=94029 RepID=A0A8T0EED6_ARGBR|nr:hypothetical protein HNY73_017655 [Argiope bruennichi]
MVGTAGNSPPEHRTHATLSNPRFSHNKHTEVCSDFVFFPSPEPDLHGSSESDGNEVEIAAYPLPLLFNFFSADDRFGDDGEKSLNKWWLEGEKSKFSSAEEMKIYFEEWANAPDRQLRDTTIWGPSNYWF